MSKVERDGMVAILISPGYGAGWSTWAEYSEQELILFDPDIVQLVLDRNNSVITSEMFHEQVSHIWQLKSYTSYCSPEALKVQWLPVGTIFRISEYDGAETLIMNKDDIWHVA